jgi:hypothetical protein
MKYRALLWRQPTAAPKEKRREGELLSRRKRALRIVEHEPDRPARTSACSARWSCTCSPPGTKPPASTARSATMRAPPPSAADSTIMAWSPVHGFQRTSAAQHRTSLRPRLMRRSAIGVDVEDAGS